MTPIGGIFFIYVQQPPTHSGCKTRSVAQLQGAPHGAAHGPPSGLGGDSEVFRAVADATPPPVSVKLGDIQDGRCCAL